MTDLTAYRNQLMAAASAFAETVQARPNVAGIAQYGSLAHGELTSFSDVDLFVVYDGGEPETLVEHRVVDGIKVDLISVEMSVLEELPPNLESLFGPQQVVSSYILKSLLLTGPETVLFDPSGRISQVKSELQQPAIYDRLVAPILSELYHETVGATLAEARRSLEDGDLAVAKHGTTWAAATFGWIARDLIPTKNLQLASERLGIPRLYDLKKQVEDTVAPDGDTLERVWQAANALWTHFLAEAYTPLQKSLQAQGVEDPGKLELRGSYNLFWPGPRIHELGRVLAEFDLSLRWSRHEIDRGEFVNALDILWPFWASESLFQKWAAIDDALRDAGYDSGGIAQSFIENDETKRQGEALDAARTALKEKPITRNDVEEMVAIAEEMSRLLADAYHFLSQEEIDRRRSDPSSSEQFRANPATFVDYLGSYDYGAGLGLLAVTLEEGRLFAQIPGQLRFELLPHAEDEFLFRTISASIRFLRDEEETVIKGIHTQNGETLEVPKVG